MIALVLLLIVGALAGWTAIALLAAGLLGRVVGRRDEQVPVELTERGKTTALMCLGIVAAVVLALATRGQVVTWDGVVTVGVPA